MQPVRDDFIEYGFSSFGILKSYYLAADGYFRIIDERAARQNPEMECQEGKISEQKYVEVVGELIKTGFFTTNNLEASDDGVGICEGSDWLRAKVGDQKRQLDLACENSPAAKEIRQIMSQLSKKMEGILQGEDKQSCGVRTCEEINNVACSPLDCGLIPEVEPAYRYCPAASRPIKDLVFTSQQTCETATGRSCGFVECDFIPAGKTPEEVCPLGMRNGWQPKEIYPVQ